jgi:Ribbon-helix-helix protein, copG family
VQRFHVCLGDPTLLAVQHEAEALGLSKSEVIRRALDEHFAHASPIQRPTAPRPPHPTPRTVRAGDTPDPGARRHKECADAAV